MKPTRLIRCVVEGAHEDEGERPTAVAPSDPMDWPLFRARALPVADPVPALALPRAFLWTSPRAVALSLPPFHALCDQAPFSPEKDLLGAVGESTSARLARDFKQSLGVRLLGKIIEPKESRGLASLLDFVLDAHPHLASAVIFTASDGRTKETIRTLAASGRRLPSGGIHVLEVYDLVALDEAPAEVRAVLDAVTSGQCKVILSCRSGRMVDTVVSLLCAHFGVGAPAELPRGIAFSPWEASAVARSKELGVRLSDSGAEK